ncbi:MAG: imidazole glycerol phosphate synthase subunit HisF [Flavobacteriaceae bacterium]
MLTKRIIPCLDIKDGRTVKGINFVDLKDAGDPVALAKSYAEQGADELVFLDIAATHENRGTLLDMVYEVGKQVNIPFTVGGGVKTVGEAKAILDHGADKVAVNSAAVKRPELIRELAEQFGNQCVVLAVDAKQIDGNWKVHLVGGRQATDIDLFQWVLEAQSLGAGEILFTSMDHDGTKKGFANQALFQLNKLLDIPVIASGGAGAKEDFRDAFIEGRSDAALAASVFHYGEIPLQDLKTYLKKQNIAIRL